MFAESVVFASTPMTGEQHNTLQRGSVWHDITKPCSPETSIDEDVFVKGSENRKAAFLYFIERGLTPKQSAGFVGNLQAESGLNPDITERNPQGHRGGYGIAQWSFGRRTAIENYARDNNKDLKSLQFQLDYLWEQEIMKGYKQLVYVPLVKTNTIREASDVILVHFETPKVIISGDEHDKEVAKQERAALGQKIYDLYANDPDVAAAGAGSIETNCSETGGEAEAGFVGFPLQTNKAEMSRLNGGCLKAPKMCDGGHGYTAYDIIAKTGTPILAILDGRVTRIGRDRCGGRTINVGSTVNGKRVTVAYMHTSNSKRVVNTDDKITAGSKIGYVGTRSEGCGGVAHLHIDATEGPIRYGCSRLSCPSSTKSLMAEGDKIIKLGESLYEGYSKLP